MSTSTRLTFDEFARLPEKEGIAYELDEGELLMEPSPTFLHNWIRDRLARYLAEFVAAHRLGEITVEMDFRLGPETVRNPEVAFVTNTHLKNIDVNRSPVDGAPALAVELISPNNLAQDTLKKVSQYLAAGRRLFGLFIPHYDWWRFMDREEAIKWEHRNPWLKKRSLDERSLSHLAPFSTRTLTVDSLV